MMALSSSFLRSGEAGELLLGVVGGLLHQGLALKQLPLQDVVYIDKLVVIGEVALEQIVDPRDDLRQQRLLLFLHSAGAGLREGLKKPLLAVRQRQVPLALVLEPVVRELHLGQVDALALATELQQRDQPPEEDGPLLDGGVAVVENLRQEGIDALESCPCRA